MSGYGALRKSALRFATRPPTLLTRSGLALCGVVRVRISAASGVERTLVRRAEVDAIDPNRELASLRRPRHHGVAFKTDLGGHIFDVAQENRYPNWILT